MPAQVSDTVIIRSMSVSSAASRPVMILVVLAMGRRWFSCIPSSKTPVSAESTA